jgi:hypothetical protein
MDKTQWCHNAKTGEIFSYQVSSGGLTDFPRGVWMAYGDYLTTGISSKEKAEKWAKEWGCCKECRTSRNPNGQGVCSFCGGDLEFKEIKYND